MSGITTMDGSLFSISEHADLARLIFKRFGHDLPQAAAAWSRMLENKTSDSDFFFLVSYPEHTPNCEGDCCNFQNDRNKSCPKESIRTMASKTLNQGN